MSFHIEGYITAIQEQELNTKGAMKRKEENLEKKGKLDNICRLCKKSTETFFHLISSCPEISSSLYLYLRHNAVAKVILEAVQIIKEPEQVTEINDYKTITIRLILSENTC